MRKSRSWPFGHGLFGPTLVELDTDVEKPAIDPMDVVMERVDRVISEAARAFSGLVWEAALQMAHLPAAAFRRVQARGAGKYRGRLMGPVRIGPERVSLSWSVLTVAGLVLAGCSRAPSQNVLGSFFPSWLICAGLGVVAAIVAWRLLLLVRVAEEVPAAPLMYVAFAAASALFAWLLWFGQ